MTTRKPIAKAPAGGRSKPIYRMHPEGRRHALARFRDALVDVVVDDHRDGSELVTYRGRYVGLAQTLLSRSVGAEPIILRTKRYGLLAISTARVREVRPIPAGVHLTEEVQGLELAEATVREKGRQVARLGTAEAKAAHAEAFERLQRIREEVGLRRHTDRKLANMLASADVHRAPAIRAEVLRRRLERGDSEAHRLVETMARDLEALEGSALRGAAYASRLKPIHKRALREGLVVLANGYAPTSSDLFALIEKGSK